MTTRPDWGIRPEMTIRLGRIVSADWPCRGHASSGEYGPDDLNMNQHGALSVATPTGWLGLKPGEFAILSVGEAPCACGEAATCMGRMTRDGPIAYRCDACCACRHVCETGLGTSPHDDWGWCWRVTEGER